VVEQSVRANFLLTMAKRMKAVCIHQFGGLDALSYQDLPQLDLYSAIVAADKLGLERRALAGK
jgi:hypothetical protein